MNNWQHQIRCLCKH